jgi:hypothetical protein
MLPIDARGLDDACARLYSRTARVIGWGTGSVFEYFHARYPSGYLVDNDRTRWGRERRNRGCVAGAICRARRRRDRITHRRGRRSESDRGLGAFVTVPAWLHSPSFPFVKALWMESQPADNAATKPEMPSWCRRMTETSPHVAADSHGAQSRLVVLFPERNTGREPRQSRQHRGRGVLSRYKGRGVGIGIVKSGRRAQASTNDRPRCQSILKTRTDLAVLGSRAVRRTRAWLQYRL